MVAVAAFCFAVSGPAAAKKQAPAASADGVHLVQTTGMADIRSAGDAEAYDRARQDAARKAVEEAVGTIVDSQVMTENGTLIQDRIVGKSAGYIRKIEPVKKWKESGMVYWEGRFTVGLEQLKSDVMALDLAQSRMRMPRVVIFVLEKYNDKSDTGTAGAVYAELAQKFRDKKFVIVTRQNASAGADESALFAALQDPARLTAAAVRLGAQNNAEMVVVASGQAQIASSQPEILTQSGMKSYQSSVSVQVVNVADQRVLASVVKNSAAPHIDADTGCQTALKKAAGPAADEAIGSVLTVWEDILNNGNLLTLNVTGLSITEGFQFQKALEAKFREIKEVFPKKNENGSAQYMVRYLGDGRDFAMALSTVDTGFNLSVESFDASVVTIKVSK
jgi:hypothetical protein